MSEDIEQWMADLEQWHTGLEQWMREIVRDELAKGKQ